MLGFPEFRKNQFQKETIYFVIKMREEKSQAAKFLYSMAGHTGTGLQLLDLQSLRALFIGNALLAPLKAFQVSQKYDKTKIYYDITEESKDREVRLVGVG